MARLQLAAATARVQREDMAGGYGRDEGWDLMLYHLHRLARAGARSLPRSRTGLTLTYRGADGKLVRELISPEGVAGELADLADRLAAVYGWPVEEAVLFVLTGSMPSIPRAKVGFNPDSRLTFPLHQRLALELTWPGLTERELVRLYREAGASNLWPGRPRLMTSERQAELCVFLARHLDQPATWEELRQLWNGLCRRPNRDWPYNSTAAFAAAAQRAFKTVTGVGAGKPGVRRPTPLQIDRAYQWATALGQFARIEQPQRAKRPRGRKR